MTVNVFHARVAMFPRLESRFGLQPFQKARDISGFKLRSESSSSLFKTGEFALGNTNGISAEIVEVTGYQRKLFVFLKRRTGPYVVTHLLFISAALSLLLFSKATVEKILLPGEFFVHTHCIDKLAMPRTPP